MSSTPSIIYTWTDEAPALATHSFLPIIRAFAGAADVPVETRDISLAARILARFPERLTEAQRVSDDLAELGELVTTPIANVIKLPNISASIPQLKAAIAELQAKGHDLPSYPEEPASDDEAALKRRYDAVKGSAVNPVLREGNSDRRAPPAVKAFARRNPHRMAAWDPSAKTHVSTMSDGDFRHNERSVTVPEPTTARIEHVGVGGEVTILKDGLALEAGEIVDATFMSRNKLVAFLEAQVQQAREQGVLFSLHLKATMMKVSDPILFGHAVRVYFRDVFESHGEVLERLGVDPNQGIADLTKRLDELDEATRTAIRATLEGCYERGPDLAMVNSHKGITNLHVPSDVIIDASMPPMIRDGGKMWNKHDELQECKAVVPDSSYAGVYQAVVDDCKAHGAFDPTTMGSVPNVGLMAKKAEEYGSHDKTFEISAPGTVRVVDAAGQTLLEHAVEAGDIWRACQVKDGPVRDWVQLAVRRARESGAPAIFWLDAGRPHDAQLIAKVRAELAKLDTDGLDIDILDPVEATRRSLERIRRGEDTISVTGNVLRDYLTDLFPILEIGTSAKMLSIVPLMKGGALFETGAGGSAPKHVQQFEAEGHLRWDSLGEFLALAESFKHFADKQGNRRAALLGQALEAATEKLLLERKTPSRKVHELDNRGSHFYLALYWAYALTTQAEDAALAQRFTPVAEALAAQEAVIVEELNGAQGPSQDLGGYYWPDPEKAEAAMRPSATLNRLLEEV